MVDIGSIDTPKLIVMVDEDGALNALLSVSFVAHPVRNTPDGLWFVMAPTSSKSVVVVVPPVEKGVDDMVFGDGGDTTCQKSIAP